MKDCLYWYAVYTKPRSEKKLADRLTEKGIESYLPMQRTLRQWSDRKKMVSLPLISSYVFVRIVPENYQSVLNTPGAVRYIWFSGKPAVIPDNQIQSLKLILNSDLETDSVDAVFTKGTIVRVHSGPLKGLSGELINISGKHKVMLRLDHIEKAVTVTISPKWLVAKSLSTSQ